MHKRLPALLLGCLLTAGAATAAPRASRTLVVSAPQAVADSVLAPRISYEHPVTKTIAEVKITGSTSYDDFVLANLSGLNVGDEIQIPGAALTSAVNRYLQAGYFSNARILVTKYVGDKVYLEIQLTERPRINEVNFTGISKSDREELEKRTGLRKGVQVSPNVLNRTRQLVKKYYDEKGYRDMRLDIEQTDTEGQPGYVDLTIDIDRSGKTKVRNIYFDGNLALTPHQLRMALSKTNEGFSLGRGRALSSLLKIFSQKKFVDADYKQDLQNLIKKYQSYGYRDAELLSDSIVPVPGERKVDIYLRLSEGQKYYIKDVRFVGNTKYPSQVLEQVLGIRPGDVYDQKRLESRLSTDEDAVSNLYYNNGYIFAGVDPVETNIDRDSVSLDIRISEGPQATIDKVKIRGNDIVYEDVVRRELYTKPGMLFSREDLMNSFRMLNQLGHFDAEKSIPKPVPNPQAGTVDIEYDLTPKSNDQLNLSIGWSQTGIIGSVGFTFTNFSIENLFRPSMYRGIIPQGDGQKLSITGQTNARYYNQLSVSFSDPWFGKKRPNLLSVSAFYSRTTAIDQRYYSGQLQNSGYGYGYNPYSYYGGGYGRGYGGYGYGGGYGDYGYGNSSTLYENAYDSDRSLSLIGFSVANGRRLNWPDNWFQLTASLNYTHYRLNNWSYNTFENFHHGSANDINLELRIDRNSVDNPVYTRRGSEFSLSVSLTPPYSLFDKKDYSDPNLPSADRYRFIEYHKWKYSGKLFIPLMNPTTVKRTPVLMARMEGGIINSYNKYKRSPFGTFYMGGDMMSGSMSYMNETIGLRGYKNGSIAGANYDYAYSYMKAALELRYPLIFEQSTTVWVLAFAEAGNAWRDISRYNPFDLKRSAGLGVRVMMPMIGLLGLDWGYGFDRPAGYQERGGSNIHFVLGRDL
ncbi:BamA/OMP85 family outer membrane protein [Porphyromonas sp.]